jgi:amphi-Trp domain-containing protein
MEGDMSAKQRVEFTNTVPATEAAEYLESLAKGLREGSLIVESGQSSATLEVPGEVSITLGVSADEEKGKGTIELGLGWRKREREEPEVAPGLLIVAGSAALAGVGVDE